MSTSLVLTRLDLWVSSWFTSKQIFVGDPGWWLAHNTTFHISPSQCEGGEVARWWRLYLYSEQQEVRAYTFSVNDFSTFCLSRRRLSTTTLSLLCTTRGKSSYTFSVNDFCTFCLSLAWKASSGMPVQGKAKTGIDKSIKRSISWDWVLYCTDSGWL